MIGVIIFGADTEALVTLFSVFGLGGEEKNCRLEREC